MKKIIMCEHLGFDSEFKLGGHHYAESFSKEHYDVLWLCPVYNELIYLKDKDLYKKRKGINKKPFKKIDSISTYAPYSLILYGNYKFLNTKLINKLSIDLTLPNLYKTLSENKFQEVDILWITNIKYYPLIQNVKYKKLIYRCSDNQEEFNTTCKSMVEIENEIIKKSDIVFVTSRNLIEKKRKVREDLVYLPNGVELNNFIRDKYVMPKEFKNNPRKKCIYIGAIDYWFDLKLVKKCADNLKNIDFYLIGPWKIDLSSLKKYDNIHLLGKKDYKEIPNYLYYSDVSIIPFEVSALTDSITPIKLYEYMSVGLNVVSTNFKEMEHINSPAYIGKNYNEFCDYILLAIQNKEKNKEKNIEFAKSNTWEKRFEKIKKYIEKD
ncbi:glycosyltransferase [Clostridium coskatii]|uniref:Teichuronic acid biosynthesis glycosyltransferase TuaH n=1 Tax=Clostridium coskatii TaxID=1705578 RepID=A0A170NNV2_9CLOT|nr:glycosyltransferase [Clostridium coskatii]OAA94194.1 putative teichuronic acid biosynthesis glycosyltransferase TuaH [Clostridium coskatii]OBR95536.1 putative teichuronic acid biosynthesis glycosyltransferase TuaH [Clostridium coskatii]